MSTVRAAGLEGVVAAESRICFIDGEAGILSYHGYNIHTLAENATLEEVIFLLWNGRLPNRAELEDLKAALVANRPIPLPIVDFLGRVPQANPMDVLRTAVSALSLYDPLAGDNSEEANMRKAQKLMAQTATILTTFDRLRNQKPVVPGDPKLGFAANFLYTLTGNRPDEVMERAFDVALILHADHEFNASTFAARVTAATLSDMYSAVTSAIGALKGPLHGGANQEVIKLLLEAGSPTQALKMVRDRLGLKVKVPGFGHRVYHTEDPRATHLRVLSEELGRRTGHQELFEISREIERAVKEQKGLNANVDFYSASTYYALGIPPDMFTPVFAVSRMSGWTAHIMEQQRNNRLIRPRAEYKGEPDGRPWVPIDQR
ncbi:MAG TPA: citrate synthase [Bryobacteraceae bacterium]|nr:citrate synthase [Bryobacteraceae bacterium]HOL70007.1 citrate synthase [Bryobacteraceae bacterium]HOQ44092.1 citrate synthase [Bryobacteraceae bacterium]HPQ14982.1 citrate synthase [Bryobacteraceae bacterium]HPU70410.1 citrate synthase [Bryobacteraceae bacterium]